MRKWICIILSAVLILCAVPVSAADNTVQLTGEPIFIDSETESTVWAAPNGGTLTWDKDSGTLTFHDFQYEITKPAERENLSAVYTEAASRIVLSGTNALSCSVAMVRTLGMSGKPTISGDGKLTVNGPTLDKADVTRIFGTYGMCVMEALGGSFTLDSGTIEAIGGKLTCDSSLEIVIAIRDYSSSYGVQTYGTIQINGGQLIAVGGSTSGRKIYNDSIGIDAATLIINGGSVIASGKTYGVSGNVLTFPQYSEGTLYAVGEKSGIGFGTVSDGAIVRGSAETNASEENVTDETTVREAFLPAYNEDGSLAGTYFRYEYVTDSGALAKTMAARRDNERKAAVSDPGTEISGEADSAASFALTLKNIKPAEVPQIEWTGDTPRGISLSFADDAVTLTSDGTTQKGVYPFQLIFGKNEKRVVTNESVLAVGKHAAKIVCEGKINTYFDTFSEALTAASLSENAGCRLFLLDSVSEKGNITLDGDFTLDLNGFDVTCDNLILQNGASVWGSGNIPKAEIKDGGKVGGGTYGILSATDGKTIADHLAQGAFCVQKKDENKDGLYWYEISAVESMTNAVVRPIPFTVECDNTHTKFGNEIQVTLHLHESPYYSASEYTLYKFVMINEDGTETEFPYGGTNNFTEWDSKTYERYPVKDVTWKYSMPQGTFPTEGTYTMYVVYGRYFDSEPNYDELRIYYYEQYLMRTEPFEVLIGNGTPSMLVPDKLLTLYDGPIAWNQYPYYTYTGAPQPIVYSTPTYVSGGVMQYRSDENAEWSTEIPTATEPGKHTFQCRIKGNDGFNDLPLEDGYGIINAAKLENNTMTQVKDYCFVRFSDALAAAQKEENEGRLLTLYYAEQDGFTLDGSAKIKLALESAATIGDITLCGSAQLETEYGTFAHTVSVDENACLNIHNGHFSGGVQVKNGSLTVSDGQIDKLTVSGGDVLLAHGTFGNIALSNGGMIVDLLPQGYALQANDGSIVNMYTDSIAQTVNVVEHTHDLGDIGTCDCGYEEKAIDSDHDGYVEIETVEQLQWFAYQIRSGNTLNAVLAKDIDMDGKSVIIGTSENPFTGVLDGKGKKISNYSLTVSDDNQGLFGAVYGGTVQNLTVSGNITVNGTFTHIGGAVGNAKGGAVISNIVSEVNISGTGAAKHTGGVVGSSQGLSGALTVTKCIYSGVIDLPNVSDCLGGVIGYANESVTISYCGFTGRVIGKSDGLVGGVLGYINNKDFGGLTNSFAAGYTNGSALIGVVRNCSDTVRNCLYTEGMTPFGGKGINDSTTRSVAEWNTGFAAYYLNGGLDNNTHIWRQTLGKDAYPNFTGDTVYRNGKDSFTSEKPSAFVFIDGDTVVAEQIESPCVLVAASYSGGKLTDVKVKDIAENTTVTVGKMNLNRQNADSVRVMLWASRRSMMPLCKAAEAKY